MVAPRRPRPAATARLTRRVGEPAARPAGELGATAVGDVRRLPLVQHLVRRVVHERPVQLHDAVRVLRNLVQDAGEPWHREERQLTA
jgi:hypothetical protein